MTVSEGVCATCIWPKDSFAESILFFSLYVESRDQTWVIRLATVSTFTHNSSH